MTAFVAVFCLALFAVAGLVVDGGRALAADQQARAVAEEAARAGAQALSVADLRSAGPGVDPSLAASVAQHQLQAAGLPGSVAVAGNVVRVSVDQQVPTAVLGMVGITSLSVHATAVATDLHGVVAGAP